MGEWQKEQRTLHGSLCSMDFVDGSYHSSEWWPCVKLMSSLWKMAAHWKGAAKQCKLLEFLGCNVGKRTVLRLAGRAMAQLAV